MAEKIQESDGLADHSERLLEAETASAYSIPFDYRWFSIPVLSRANMVAARIGRTWLTSLQQEESAKKAARPQGVEA